VRIFGLRCGTAILLGSLCAGISLADAPPGAPAACTYGFFWRDGFAPSPAFPGQTRAPAPARASAYRVEVVAGGLDHPWSLAFLPDGRMLVAERIGRLRTIDRNGHISEPIAGLPAMKNGPPGALWDVVLDPAFARNRLVYFNYFAPPLAPASTVEDEGLRWIAWLRLAPAARRGVDVGQGHVARARLSEDGTRLEAVRNLVDGVLEGRLRFARDGTLLITSGTPAGAGVPTDGEPQDLTNAYGKVLRIRPDGSTPRDNPFYGWQGIRPDLYSYGMRDVQGAAIRPDDGSLWTSENGPRGGDELNRQRPGLNFGFPLISYGREYSGALIDAGLTARDGLAQPVYFWTPSIAPSGMTFYDGALFPAWRGNLFVAALAGKRIERLVLDGERVVAEEPLLLERCQRMRAAYQGPDGALYVLTDEDTGQLLRVLPGQGS